MTTRRDVLAGVTLGAGALLSQGAAAAEMQPSRKPGVGGTDPGPRNLMREQQNPDMINPPSTDHGTLPNLRFTYADSHIRQESGGWTRQITERELGVSKTIAGVNMRLNAGGVRELHWHKEAEWAHMLYGSARINAIDPEGRNFVEDVGVGDLWYFPSGIPHAIQGLGPDGCEFLLVFDSGGFDEDSTFLLSDWFKHTPNEILAKNFGVDGELLSHTPDPSQLYIFAAPIPSALGPDKLLGATPVPQSFSHKMMAQEPISNEERNGPHHGFEQLPGVQDHRGRAGQIEPGGMRELHWHPNADEWQYYIEGQGRMGVFASSGQARTFDYQAGDVGYVPFAMGHYVENTGSTPPRFLEMFKSSYYADLSLNQWLALTPPELLKAHLHFDKSVTDALRKQKSPTVPV